MTSEYPLPEAELDRVIRAALAEDTTHGDPTSETLLPANLHGAAVVLVKGRGILAGIEVVGRVFQQVDPSLRVTRHIQDSTPVSPGDIAATVSGRVRSILKAERTALNFLQRLSGIASMTAQYVAETRGSKARITDTRKTTPGLRVLEKYAVRMGGGKNHRFHLGDGILIKDNHLVALRYLGLSLPDIVRRAKQDVPSGLRVEVEVTSIPEAREAVSAGADIIMLDNMTLPEMTEAVKLISGKAEVEASGGITLANVGEVARTGVDIISIGALTHSFESLDISLELDPASLKLV